MKFAVMQPYFMPYIGYFQLMSAVDILVLYDNVQFIKNGWINRNRIILNNEPKFITVPVSKGAHQDLICERPIAEEIWRRERKKMISSLMHAYRKAPFYDEIFPLVDDCLNYQTDKIFLFVQYSLLKIHEYLEMGVEIVNSSDLPIDHSLKNKHKLWAISEYLGISDYVNPQGGHDLYDKDEFREHGLKLSFHQPHLTPYAQTGVNEFFPALSIIDVLMNLGREGTRKQLDDYSLV